MYRLPEVAAAMGLAQLEKIDWFVDKRCKMALMYKEAIDAANCDWLVPQFVPNGDKNSYYSYAAKLDRDDIDWVEFRKKHVKNGGDGIFAAWALCYKEDSIPDVLNRLNKMGLRNRLFTNDGLCEKAEMIQPKLMQFTTNQKNESEMQKQADALYKTILDYQ